MLLAAVTDRLQSLIRHHVDAYPEGRGPLERLAGRVIALRLEPVGYTVFLCPTPDDIQILTEFSHSPDVMLSGSLASFARAGLAGGSQQGLRASGIRISGDSDTAHEFQVLSQALKIDWQRSLSPYLGAGATAALLSALDIGAQWTRETLSALQADVSEYLREERRLLPDRSQTDAWAEAVDRLRADTDRLHARLARLEGSLDRVRPMSLSSDSAS